jgi:hypothetical protein
MNKRDSLSTGNIINFVEFYIGWFACVIGAAQDNHWMGPVIVLLIIIVQLRFFSNYPGKEILFLLIVGIFGFLLETAVIMIAVHEPARLVFTAQFCPLWMLGLWINFGLTFNHCLKFLRSHLLISAILGAVGGPLAYWGGYKFGALSLNANMFYSYGILAVVWGVTVPLLLVISTRIVPRESVGVK